MFTQCSLVRKVCSGSNSITCDLSAKHGLMHYFFYLWLCVQHTDFTQSKEYGNEFRKKSFRLRVEMCLYVVYKL